MGETRQRTVRVRFGNLRYGAAVIALLLNHDGAVAQTAPNTQSYGWVPPSKWTAIQPVLATTTEKKDDPWLPVGPNYDQDLPAVSALNFKVEGGGLADDTIGPTSGSRSARNYGEYGAGSATFPLGHNFGASLDAVAGSLSGTPFTSGAAHVFWRNPREALFGVYGSIA